MRRRTRWSRLPSAAEPAKAGDAVVAPKQDGAQGFYKVWESDAPIKAEWRRYSERMDWI